MICNSTFTFYPSYAVTTIDEDDEAPLDDTEFNLPIAKGVPGKISGARKSGVGLANYDGSKILRIGNGLSVETGWRVKDESTDELFAVANVIPVGLYGGGFVLALTVVS